MCSLLAEGCVNLHQDSVACHDWAEAGRCDTSAWMLEFCAESCGLCVPTTTLPGSRPTPAAGDRTTAAPGEKGTYEALGRWRGGVTYLCGGGAPLLIIICLFSN